MANITFTTRIIFIVFYSLLSSHQLWLHLRHLALREMLLLKQMTKQSQGLSVGITTALLLIINHIVSSLQFMYFFSAVFLKPVCTYSVHVALQNRDHWLALPSPQLIYITLMNYNTTSKTKDNTVTWLSMYGHIATLNVTIIILL